MQLPPQVGQKIVIRFPAAYAIWGPNTWCTLPQNTPHTNGPMGHAHVQRWRIVHLLLYGNCTGVQAFPYRLDY